MVKIEEDHSAVDLQGMAICMFSAISGCTTRDLPSFAKMTESQIKTLVLKTPYIPGVSEYIIDFLGPTRLQIEPE